MQRRGRQLEAVAGPERDLVLTDLEHDRAADHAERFVVVAAFTPPPNPIAGQPAAFTDTSSDADGVVVSRSWDFGDGNTSTQRNPSHTYAQAGEYTVRLTVRDDDGATATTTRTVRVCGSIGAVPGKLLFSVTGTQRLDLYAFDTQSLATSRITFQSGPATARSGSVTSTSSPMERLPRCNSLPVETNMPR